MGGLLRNTFIRMAMVALVLFFGVLFVTLRLENNDLADRADELRSEISALEEDVKSLQAELDRPFDAEYIAEVAEEKLGLRYPQDIVFYTGDGNE